jgi:hypothetical protein
MSRYHAIAHIIIKQAGQQMVGFELITLSCLGRLIAVNSSCFWLEPLTRPGTAITSRLGASPFLRTSLASSLATHLIKLAEQGIRDEIALAEGKVKTGQHQ